MHLYKAIDFALQEKCKIIVKIHVQYHELFSLKGKKSKGYSKPVTSKQKIAANRNKEVKAPAPSNKTIKQVGYYFSFHLFLEV